MAYAQHVRSPKGDYYIGRYTDAYGKRGVAVTDPRNGKPVRHKSSSAARKAANAAEATREARAAEAEAEALKEAERAAAPMLFSAWAERWYAAQRLAENTMANYASHLGLALARFADYPMTDEGFPAVDVDAWEEDLVAIGYAPDSVRTYRGTLHTCLEDAVPQLLSSNPAARKANRGKRGVAKANAASRREKIITSVLGGFLVAERMSILTGRPDEFVMTVTIEQCALRLGEAIGLETCYLPPAYSGPGTLRVEWQLAEVRGKLIKTIPKYGSRGDVVTAPYLDSILADFQRTVIPAACPCHGCTYIFRGLGTPRGTPKSGVTIRDVAEAAGVSVGTVSNVITRPETVPAKTRAEVERAAKALGWVPGSAPVAPAWHWRRSAFEELFTMAASGRFPERVRRRGLAGQAVPMTGEWPGTRITGRNAAAKAEWCWMPVARGLTPHGLRHSRRTWMEGNRVHQVLAEAQMRHEQTGVDIYRHVTDGMRQEFRGLAQEAWNEALGRRLEMSPGSPVPFVDRLLKGRSGEVRTRTAQERPRIVASAK